ncbi:MAG: aldehyde dehydrogenase family protein, partial [Bacteroidota bacterium]
MAPLTLRKEMQNVLDVLGISPISHGIHTGIGGWKSGGALLESHSPVDGELIGSVYQADRSDYEKAMKMAVQAFQEWRLVPAPRRGELVRLVGQKLREFKDPLGRLVSYEMGKSLQEGLGEVQEMID